MSTLVLSQEELQGFMKDTSMNNQYGIQVFLSLDPARAQALLPPPLKLAGTGLGFIYIVNIREPTFAPWYMEGGIGIMAEYNGTAGIHFLGLMLSGPGAFMGACSGRDGSGLPKKLCERILVERLGQRGRCRIERNGMPLVDVQLTMGAYNDPCMAELTGAQEKATPANPVVLDGGCLLFRHRFGGKGAFSLEMIHYDSPTRFYSWEPATAEVALASTADDPWGELPVTGVLGAGWMVSDNWVKSMNNLYTYPEAEAGDALRYLFRGRYDQCTLCREHQWYAY